MQITCARNCIAGVPMLSFRPGATASLHIPHDAEAYKWRHLIENYFSKIKEFRGVNTRYDKTDTSYRATWNIAATILALR